MTERFKLKFLDENLIRCQCPVTYANSSDNNVISQIGSSHEVEVPTESINTFLLSFLKLIEIAN